MKLLMVICFVCIASGGGIDAYVTKINEKVNQYITECIEEAEKAEYDVNKSIDVPIFPREEDPNLQKISQCFFHKAGILEPGGELNIDAALSVLSLIGVEKNDAEKLLQKCTSITGFDAKDTAYAIFKCFEDGFRP